MPVPDPLPAAGPPNPTSANLGASLPVPVPDVGPGHMGRPLQRLGPARRQPVDPAAGQFDWAAGDDTRSHVPRTPGPTSGTSRPSAMNGAVAHREHRHFTIRALPDIPIESYRAALTGNALTGNAGTTVDTCNLGLPSNCQNLRATPVLGWDIAGPQRRLLQAGALAGRRAHQPDRDQGHRQHDVPRPGRARGQPGRLGVLLVVLPCTADGHCSPLTHATHSFNKLTRPLTLVSPLDGAQVQNDVTLTWDDYLDSQKVVDGADPDTSTPLDTPGQVEAEYYSVQTASDQNFTQNVTTTKVDQTTFTSFADTYPEGTTWWRVQAVDRNGNTLAWSAPRSFLKKSPVPQLQLPDDGDTVPGDYTLSWAAQPYAASYDLEVYKGGDTSGQHRQPGDQRQHRPGAVRADQPRPELRPIRLAGPPPRRQEPARRLEPVPALQRHPAGRHPDLADRQRRRGASRRTSCSSGSRSRARPPTSSSDGRAPAAARPRP